MISVKFLLVISLLYKTQWSWELKTWSYKMNLIDSSTNSLYFFYWKRIGTTRLMRIWILILGFKGLSEQFYLWLSVQNHVSTPIKTLYFYIPISGQSLWANVDTFRVYELDFSFVLSSHKQTPEIKLNLICLWILLFNKSTVYNTVHHNEFM